MYRDDAGEFEGRGFWGYNTVDRRHEGLWIDSLATFFQLEYGEHDSGSDTYTMTGSMTDPSTAKTIRKRSVITYHGPDAHTMEMFFGDAVDQMKRSMEIRYTRA